MSIYTIARWIAAFTDGLRRGRHVETITPRRMPATADPDLHPFEYVVDR